MTQLSPSVGTMHDVRALRVLSAAVVGLGVLVGCSADNEPAATRSVLPPSASTTTASELPTGRDDLTLDAGTYRSPLGFVPAVEVTLPAGWRSVHRESDAFDLGRDDPDTDAPLVGVVFVSPPEGTAEDALAAIRQRATGQVAMVGQQIDGVSVGGLDIRGGRGSLIKSAGNSIELDASAKQRMRVFAVASERTPLLVVAVVPPGERWSELWPAARAVIQTVAVG